MHTDRFSDMSLEEYRTLEIQLHTELMKICRKYMNELGIVSIMGIIDIVKQETVELERATKSHIVTEQPAEEKPEEFDTDSFSEEQPPNEQQF
jgi:hypothetical protein